MNRLRTRLSIPLGLRHEGSTPVPSQRLFLILQFVGYRTHKAVALVAVEALGVYRLRQSAKIAVRVRGCGIRFLTIATCFLAAAICCNQYASSISTCAGNVLCVLLVSLGRSEIVEANCAVSKSVVGGPCPWRASAISENFERQARPTPHHSPRTDEQLQVEGTSDLDALHFRISSAVVFGSQAGCFARCCTVSGCHLDAHTMDVLIISCISSPQDVVLSSILSAMMLPMSTCNALRKDEGYVCSQEKTCCAAIGDVLLSRTSVRRTTSMELDSTCLRYRSSQNTRLFHASIT